MKFVISYSGGKDSALAFHRMLKAGHTPVAMLTTINPEQERSWFHGMQSELLQAVSERLGIPLIPCYCKPSEYGNALETGLRKAKDLGAEACVFGDIDIPGHLEWNTERCKHAGLGCILPLWQEDREQLATEVITSGFKAVVKIVQCEALGSEFLGETLTLPLLGDISATGSDVCGENGEYHTFVYDGPIFSEAIPIALGDIIDLGTHQAIDIIYQPK